VSALPKPEEECFFIAPIGADSSDERLRSVMDLGRGKVDLSSGGR
jgi:hypothetical protein